MRVIALLVALVLLGGSAFGQINSEKSLEQVLDDSGWEFIKESDEGVKVYRKDIPGVDVAAFKGVLVSDVDPDHFIALAADIPKAKGMSKKVPVRDSIFLMGDANSTVFDYYQYLDTPGWTLAADRWWINRGWIEKDIGGETDYHRMRWMSLPESAYPKKVAAVRASDPDAVMVPNNVGAWEIRPIGGGKVTITYMVLSDPGGRIPSKLQDMVTLKTLPDTVLMYEHRAR